MDKADAYAAAERIFNGLDKRITEAADTMRAVSAALTQNRAKVSFANTFSGLPIDVGLGPNAVSFDARTFPAPDQLMALLREWHDAKAKLLEAWTNLPREWRDRMTPPPAIQPSIVRNAAR